MKRLEQRCYLCSYNKEVYAVSADRITKKQLKHDSFVTAMVRAWEYARENQNTVFVVLLVLVVVVVGAIWLNQSRTQSRVLLSNRFGEALTYFMSDLMPTAEQTFKLVHEQSPRSREGVFALYFTGKCALLQGRNLEAIELFDSYIDSGKRFNLFHDAALAGKAAALENERRYEEAAELYFELAEHPVTNDFFKKEYLTSAAENFKKGHKNDKAIGVMEELLDITEGIERRDLEIEIALLRG